MKVLIKQAHIICQGSPHNNSVKDILISNGIIQHIDDNIDVEAEHVVSHDNLHVSIGWMDVFAHFSDPGHEERESIASGAAAAAAGGFTDVMIIPNTNPVVCTKSQVEYINSKSAELPVNIHPIGTVTKNAEGKELAEMYDMHESGAIAFSDGLNSIQQANIMTKALQYVLANDKVIIQIPDEKSISAHGLVNEGIVSTKMGLPGKPAIAEELMIMRDIELLKYTGSKLHITGISTRKSVELIAAAKKAGLQITCSATPYHSYFSDEDLAGYDTNLKVNPPLRNQDDKTAIREALNNGTIDCIASHHIPLNWDDKTCEFEYAKYGMTGLENVFSVFNSIFINLEHLINNLTIHPRHIFGLPTPRIEENAEACLTFFQPEETYTLEASQIRSKARNNPFIGKQLEGKVVGIFNKGKFVAS
jgi:dihydroorotase